MKKIEQQIKNLNWNVAYLQWQISYTTTTDYPPPPKPEDYGANIEFIYVNNK